jgi:hypothetical protein
LRRFSEKGFKVGVAVDLLLQSRPVIAGQPAKNRIDFFFCASF